MTEPALDDDVSRLLEARHHDPFSVLGRQTLGEQVRVRVLIPYASEVRLVEGNFPMARIEETDLFEWCGPTGKIPIHYHVSWRDDRGEHMVFDPYSFTPPESDFDRHLFAEGNYHYSYRFLGAHEYKRDGVPGIRFIVWAPNAERVSVVGDFNRWDGRIHPMQVHSGSGIWELFIPELPIGSLYKYEIRNRETGAIVLKADPYGQQCELRPNTASVIIGASRYEWKDWNWMEERAHFDWQHCPISVYEVHLGSWQRDEQGNFLSYGELARRLVDYVTDMGFTHVELLPIAEHPYDPSWGYQTTGYFAPTSRFGSPDDFRRFVDILHQAGISVLLDWVPAHFPKDAHGLARFDGSALYEHADPRLGEHLDWSTYIFNYGRNEVRNFLVSSALYWLDEYHIDGLRVDAVASMLYLDYSRTDWLPNRFGGRENLEAIDFLRQLNVVVHQHCPGILMIAEESTSWGGVTRPTYEGGLGFDIKWDMGWMNDTLRYMAKEPVHRKYHQNMLTFSMLYTYTENFMLPFSHDEVVHGKGSMPNKMPGDEWQRFANLRLLYSYMFTHPGKKMLFMGTEFGQGNEWNCEKALDWWVLQYDCHQGMHNLVRDLVHLYSQIPALYRHDFEPQGFQWIDCDDNERSLLSYLRFDGDDFLVVVANFTPVPRSGYCVGIPRLGMYREIFNSDSTFYGGSNVGNGPDPLIAEAKPWMERPYSLTLTLPPLGVIILQPIKE